MTPLEFRDGLFSLPIKKFGVVCELITQQHLNLRPSGNSLYDLEGRAEVKFSVVRPKPLQRTKLRKGQGVQYIEEAIAARRIVNFCTWRDDEFVCYFNQVKKYAFKELYYGLCFEECIKLFKIASDEIDERVNYVNVQHRGNVGEGQFHLTHKTLPHHLVHYLMDTMTYSDVMRLIDDVFD